MIIIKNNSQLNKMRESGSILSDVFKLMEDNVRAGVTTKYLDNLCYNYITKHDAIPSFLNYNGFPATICASIDDEVVHGIPSEDRVLEEGQIIGLDIGVYFNGFHSDAARTFEIGSCSEEKQKLVRVTKESFFKGVENLKAGVRLGDLGACIQRHCEENGMSVVRSLVGHGIGKSLHEDPSVPNYGVPGHGIRLKAGMTIAVEPMVNLGTYKVTIDQEDDWTVRTADGRPSAHYENTIIILSDGIDFTTLK